MAANTAAVAELREKKAEIDDTAVGADGWSSKHIVDMLCPKIEESGNPVQCYPVAGYPLGVKASWEPMQEGEGEPYPAGGGVNQLDLSKCTPNEATYGITCTIEGNKIHLKGTIASNLVSMRYRLLSVPDDYYDKSGGEHAVFDLKVSSGVTPKTISLFNGSTTDKFIVIEIIFDEPKNGQNIDLTFRPMRYFGDTTPTAYSPYENIRPIVGRDSVTVERCGENLLDSMPELPIRIYKDSPKVVVRSGTLPAGRYTMNVKLDVIPSGDSLNSALIKYELADGTEKYFVPRAQNEIVATVTFATAIRTITVVNYGVIDGNITGISLVPGSAALTTYEPYTGQSNTLTLPETVYGGSVDAVTGSGERAWRMLPLDGTENWFTWGVNANNAAVTGFFTYDIADYKVEDDKAICSHLPHPSGDTWGGRNEGVGFASAGSSRYLMCCVKTKILDDVSSDANAITSWKAYLAAQYAAGTPVQVCYKLATPVPFTATGGAALPALAGVNTVITDANSVAVTGRADPIKRIEDLEAAVASIN